ncbi:MAG: TIGR03663 family protein, partial [Chloroflexi bacterium]|nr:TIGR03663 family protein [Chloroflexota bacterium]
ERPKAKYLYLTAAAVALGFAAKETTFITYFIFGTFLAGLLAWQWWQGGRRTLSAFTELPAFDLVIVMGTLILPLATPFPIKMLGRDPVDYSQAGILFSGAVFMVMLAISAAVGLWWNWRRWLVCAGIYYAIFVPLFTTMFTNGQGFATGMVGQLGYWLSQQEVKRGGQPFYYYLVLMPMYEFLPLLVGGAGALYYLMRGEPQEETPQKADSLPQTPFVLWIIYWAFAAFALYSWAGEKMPWLTMHLAVPLHLLAGWAIARLLLADWEEIRSHHGLWLLLIVPLFLYTLARLMGGSPYSGTSTEALSRSMAWLAALMVAVILGGGIYWIGSRLSAKNLWRMIALSLIVLLLALTVRFAWMVTYINADLASEFLVYAQGAPDTAIVARELEEMSRRLTGGLHMKVAYDDDTSWPFVWYLRNFDNAQFYGKKPGGPFDAEVVLVGPPNEAGIKPMLGNKYYRRQYRLIWWPNQDWYMNLNIKQVWANLKNPVARKEFWDVVFYRKHTASLTSWPFVHNFAMYVRRDVAQQLWDYGPETLAAVEPLPGDEYIERWEQRQALAAWGSQGSGAGQFMAPKGLAVDAAGNVYVADSQNHRVQVLAPDGSFLREWGSEGNAPGQFKEPWGIAVSPEGDVFVADTWNHRIQVFDDRGNFKRMWGTFAEVSGPMGSGNSLYGPRDIVFDRQGNLYVSDTGNKRVVKYDQRGNMLTAAGGAGDAEGQMQEPVGLAIDDQGRIYVADTWNQRIQVFDDELRFQRQWPVHAWEGMSVVNKPYLAVDANGDVYATDPEGYRVLQFDPEGKILRSWGQLGADLSSMNLPTGIAVDGQGRIIISDSENNRLLVFAP